VNLARPRAAANCKARVRGMVQALKALLADPARPTGTLLYHELQGLFVTLPSAWRWSFLGCRDEDGKELRFASVDQPRRLTAIAVVVVHPSHHDQQPPSVAARRTGRRECRRRDRRPIHDGALGG